MATHPVLHTQIHGEVYVEGAFHDTAWNGDFEVIIDMTGINQQSKVR